MAELAAASSDSGRLLLSLRGAERGSNLDGALFGMRLLRSARNDNDTGAAEFAFYSTPSLLSAATPPASMPSQLCSTSALSPPSAGEPFKRTVLPSTRTGQLAIL